MKKTAFAFALALAVLLGAACSTTGSGSGDPDARRAALNANADAALSNLFRQVDVPIAGIVENMAYFIPPDLPDRRFAGLLLLCWHSTLSWA